MMPARMQATSWLWVYTFDDACHSVGGMGGPGTTGCDATTNA
jgi:hypothetical protein